MLCSSCRFSLHRHNTIYTCTHPLPCKRPVFINLPHFPKTDYSGLTRVDLYMLLCCLQRNIETSCHKHFVVVSRKKNKRCRLPGTSITNLSRSCAAVCIAPGSRTIHSTRWSQILAENRDFCLSPPAFDTH